MVVVVVIWGRVVGVVGGSVIGGAVTDQVGAVNVTVGTGTTVGAGGGGGAVVGAAVGRAVVVGRVVVVGRAVVVERAVVGAGAGATVTGGSVSLGGVATSVVSVSPSSNGTKVTVVASVCSASVVNVVEPGTVVVPSTSTPDPDALIDCRSLLRASANTVTLAATNSNASEPTTVRRRPGDHELASNISTTRHAER